MQLKNKDPERGDKELDIVCKMTRAKKCTKELEEVNEFLKSDTSTSAKPIDESFLMKMRISIETQSSHLKNIFTFQEAAKALVNKSIEDTQANENAVFRSRFVRRRTFKQQKINEGISRLNKITYGKAC